MRLDFSEVYPIPLEQRAHPLQIPLQYGKPLALRGLPGFRSIISEQRQERNDLANSIEIDAVGEINEIDITIPEPLAEIAEDMPVETRVSEVTSCDSGEPPACFQQYNSEVQSDCRPDH